MLFFGFVDGTVDFYNQSEFGTIEVCDDSFDWVLATELEAGELAVPHSFPKDGFCPCLASAEISGQTLAEFTFGSIHAWNIASVWALTKARNEPGAIRSAAYSVPCTS